MPIIHVLIAILLFVLVAGSIWWCINKLATVFGFPAPIVAVIQVIFVLLCLLALLDYTGIFTGGLRL